MIPSLTVSFVSLLSLGTPAPASTGMADPRCSLARCSTIFDVLLIGLYPVGLVLFLSPLHGRSISCFITVYLWSDLYRLLHTFFLSCEVINIKPRIRTRWRNSLPLRKPKPKMSWQNVTFSTQKNIKHKPKRYIDNRSYCSGGMKSTFLLKISKCFKCLNMHIATWKLFQVGVFYIMANHGKL